MICGRSAADGCGGSYGHQVVDKVLTYGTMKMMRVMSEEKKVDIRVDRRAEVLWDQMGAEVEAGEHQD